MARFAREFKQRLERMSVEELWNYDRAGRFRALGFEMDCGHSFNDTTGLLPGNERGLARVLASFFDVKLLGDVALLQRRYITHWSFALERESVGRIASALGHMEELASPAAEPMTVNSCTGLSP